MPIKLKEKITSWLWQLLQHRLIGPVQPVDIFRPDGSIQEDILAAVDTMAELSSIDKDLVKELGLTLPENPVQREFTLHGKTKIVPILPVTFRVNEQVRTGQWAVVSRAQEKHLVSLGKPDIGGFLIELPDESEPDSISSARGVTGSTGIK